MSFSREDTAQKIVAIIAEKLNLPKETVKMDLSFKDLGADSLDIVEIIMSFEETFGIQIKDEDAEAIKTINHAVDLIHNARVQ